MRLLPSCLLLLSHALPAFAVHGVVEISRTCALQTGCGQGDAARYPVTINAGGSYRLTSDLSFPITDPPARVIRVVGADVTMDLNGFTIIGSITGSNPAIGIESNSVEVRNGTIRGASIRVAVGRPQALAI